MNLKQSPKDSWAIGIENTALIVIDMQRAFLEEGAPLEIAGGRKFIPKINQLAAACRKLKIPIIWIKGRLDPSDAGLIPEMTDHSVHAGHDLMVLDGKPGNELFPGLVVKPDDYIIWKKRYSSFIRGSSDLESLLRKLNTDRFIITGVATDVCVGTTTMDAMMLGFKVFFISDLTATFSEERHRIALEVYNRHFAKVMSFDEVMEELAQLEL